MQVGLWQTRIFVVLKDVAIVTHEGMFGNGIQIDIHIFVLHIVERSHIIQTCNMITVGMSNHDGIETFHFLSQHLLTEIGADVEEDMLAVVGGKQSGSAQTPVAFIDRPAHAAAACYHWHTLRCPGA